MPVQMQIIISAMKKPSVAIDHDSTEVGVNVQYAWVDEAGNAQPCADLGQVLKIMKTAEAAVERMVGFTPPAIMVVGKEALPAGLQ